MSEILESLAKLSVLVFAVGGMLAMGLSLTIAQKGWFTLFRLYSPTEAFFDQSWKPGDFEKID